MFIEFISTCLCSVHFRSVEPQDRAIGLGMNAVVMRLLGELLYLYLKKYLTKINHALNFSNTMNVLICNIE